MNTEKTFAPRKLPFLIVASTISTLPLASLAQSLEEVLVTATRVESSAQNTAVALNIHSGADLVSQGIANVQALQTIDPSLNVTTSTGAAYVAVRGVASTDVTETGDPSVPIARDGFFTNRSWSIQGSMYDVSRVEVLKGPQGTLFGRNASGGLINIITRRPTQDLEGMIAVDVGNYNARNFEAMVNVPIGDRVQMRFSGIDRNHDGYRKVEPIGLEADDENMYSWRAQLAFQPVEHLKGWISFQKDRTDQVGDTPYLSPLETLVDIDAIDTENYPGYAPVHTDIDGERTRWELTYENLPWAMEVSYSGGYDKQSWAHAMDATAPEDTYFATFPPAGPPDVYELVPTVFYQTETPRTYNHEIRFATPQDQKFTAQFGYFYFKEDNSLASRFVKLGGPFEGSLGPIAFAYQLETESSAFFGQVGYRFNDQFKVTAGARRTNDKKQRTGEATLDLTVASGGAAAPADAEHVFIITPGNGDIDQTEPTYHLGLEWTPTDNTLVYAKFDTGYKAGGFNSNGTAPSVNYDPESVKAWELGVKNNLLGNTLQLNASVYRMEYEGYQASQFTDQIAGEAQGVFNAGDATINGFETQLIALVGDHGKFDVNATFLDAKFDDLDELIVDGADNARDISGNELPNAPELAVTAGYEHTFPVGQGELKARIDGKHSSSFYFSAFNDPDARSPAYTTGNLSLSYAPDSERWLAQAYVRNFTDEAVLASASRFYVSYWNIYSFQPPRTYGVRFSYNF